MKSKFVILIGMALGASSAFGAIYNLTTGTLATSNGIAPTGLVTSLSATTPAGTFTGFQDPGSAGVVTFGYFSVTDAAISDATSLSTIVGAFVQFGATLDKFNVAGPTGSKGVFAHSQSATVAGSGFSGKNIYVFAGNGSTFGNSTELLVLKSTTLFADSQDAIPTAATVTLTSATASLLFGRNLADVRTTTTDASVTAGWGTATAPAAIPEPSAALLGAIGALGLLRRRRN